MTSNSDISWVHPTRLLLACSAAVLLAACGGGSETDSQPTETAQAATFDLEAEAAADAPVANTESESLPAEAAAAVVEPSFHLAPVILDEPDDGDVTDNSASALSRPRVQSVPAEAASLPTRGLTVQLVDRARRSHALGTRAGEGSVAPQAAGSSVLTYTPAQIRAAYGLPPLVAKGVTPTAAQAAQLGAGQTIYIVNAHHNPNVVAELAAFNQKFGLPTCITRAIPANVALPLAAAPRTEGCVLSVVYATPQATMTATPPTYEAGWATEIALDVQWAHATAPLARIVVIEAPDASVNSLVGAIRLANAMGPGVVSMSFGATEGNWTASVDSAFTGAGMSYLAATGDWGTQVSWPAVSPKVLAVSGTTLSYTGTGPRSEVTWSNTGGGMSLYTPTPGYQTNKVVGMGTLARRAVADVAFNADPSTGQFVAVMQPSSSTVNWMSAGGTSLSTPQWAGLVAVANAMRALSGKGALGLAHPTIYAQIGSVPGTYASAFADITVGSNGSCAGCVAKSGYDQPTGLGTPHVAGLLGALSGASVPATAPVVTATTINGKAGTALSHALSVTGGTATGFSLANAPAGMTISSSGTISWTAPVAGTYSVTVTATGAAGLSGKGVLTFVITKVAAPVITASALTGVAGKPLSGSIRFTDASGTGLAVSISGVPMGMGFGVSGSTLLISWPRPVTGRYSLTVVARNGAGQSTQVSVPITINAK